MATDQTSTLSIQSLSDSDLGAMQAIEARSNPFPWTAKNLASALQHNPALGVFDADCLIAFLLYRVVINEAEIIHLVCDKPYQGKRIAYHLLRSAIDTLTAADIDTFFLEARKTNVAAQKLYQRLGFVTIAERKHYYGNHQHALIQRYLPYDDTNH